MINEKIGKHISLVNKYENFETGEIVDLVKTKPNQPMKNICKIEIIDSITGKVKQRSISENIVNNYIDRLVTQLVFVEHVFTNYGGLSESYLLGRGLFSALFLTDYTGAEDANLSATHGKVIGWADRRNVYTGADTKRGSINLSESMMIDKDTIKLVFDFPTTAGNGTFRTVYMCPTFNTASATTWSVPTPAITTTAYVVGTVLGGSGSDLSPSCVVGDKRYNTDATGKIYSTKMLLTSLGVGLARDLSTGVIEKDLAVTDNAIKGVQWDGTNFWTFGDQTDKMYKLDTSFNVVSSWSITVATYMNANRQFVCFGGKIYTVKYVNSTTINLYKFATDGTLENTYNILTSGGNFDLLATKDDTLMITTDETTIWVISNSMTPSQTSTVGVIETNGNGVVQADYSLYTKDGTWTGKSLCWNSNYKLWENHNGTSSYVINILKKPTTQTLLASNVTKTSSDFMKISYTLNVDLSAL